MKSTKKDEVLEEEIKFPQLMISNSNHGLVVLMLEDKNGVVVHTDEGNEHKLGYISESWTMEVFETYNGEVSIKN